MIKTDPLIDREIIEQTLNESFREKLSMLKLRLDNFKRKPDCSSEVFRILEKELILTGLCREELTLDDLTNILKKHNLRSDYEFIPFIHGHFIDKSYMNLSNKYSLVPSEYDTIIIRFIAFMDVYYSIKSYNQKPFPPIQYIIYKLLITIDRPDIADSFTLLKSDIKKSNLEDIWKEIYPKIEYAYICRRTRINPKNYQLTNRQIIEPIIEQLTEPIIEPITEQLTEPIIEPITEPITEQLTEPLIETKSTEPLDADKIFIDPLVKSLNDVQTYGNNIIHNIYDTFTLLFSGCINRRFDESDNTNNNTNNREK
jgi:hypothetical protein